MPSCAVDWQPIIAATAGLIVLISPAVAALVVAMGNRSHLISAQRTATFDRATSQQIRHDLRAVIARLDAPVTNGEGDGHGHG